MVTPTLPVIAHARDAGGASMMRPRLGMPSASAGPAKAAAAKSEAAPKLAVLVDIVASLPIRHGVLSYIGQKLSGIGSPDDLLPNRQALWRHCNKMVKRPQIE